MEFIIDRELTAAMYAKLLESTDSRNYLAYFYYNQSCSTVDTNKNTPTLRSLYRIAKNFVGNSEMIYAIVSERLLSSNYSGRWLGCLGLWHTPRA